MSEPKTLDDQLTAALADAKAAQDLATQAQTALDAKATELAAAKAENEASATALAAVTAERDALKASVTASNAEAEKQKALAGQLASELATLKASVASNPAFAHAGAGRAAVQTPASGLTADAAWQEYNRLAASDPKAATTFYRQNSKILSAARGK